MKIILLISVAFISVSSGYAGSAAVLGPDSSAALHFGGSSFGEELPVTEPEETGRAANDEASPGVTFNYFLGEVIDDPFNNYSRPKNSFLNERSDKTEVDAYGGYLKDAQTYDPYHVFGGPRNAFSDGTETSSEYERLSSESEPTRPSSIAFP